MEGRIRYRWKQFYALSLFFLILTAVFCLLGCRLGSDDPKVVESLTVSWTSYEEDGGAIILSWASSGGKDDHRYILQRLTAESDWLPEDDVLYSEGDSSIPGLLYAGTDVTYTDSSASAGRNLLLPPVCDRQETGVYRSGNRYDFDSGIGYGSR